MLKKTTIFLALMSILLGKVSFANTHELIPNVRAVFHIKPNTPETFTNIFMKTITAECTIKLEEKASMLHLVGIARSIIIDNSFILNKGEMMDYPLVDGQIFTLTALSGSRVLITNIGEFTIEADCITK